MKNLKIIGIICLILACVFFEIWYGMEYFFPNLDMGANFVMVYFLCILPRILIYSLFVIGYNEICNHGLKS
jgi:hypothetical protein